MTAGHNLQDLHFLALACKFGIPFPGVSREYEWTQENSHFTNGSLSNAHTHFPRGYHAAAKGSYCLGLGENAPMGTLTPRELVS